MKLFPLFVATLGLGLGLPVRAQNLIANGDFETPPFAPDSTITEWDVSGTGKIHSASEGATSGTHGAAFNIGGDFEGTILSQTFPTTAGRLYRLDFDSGIFGQKTGAPLQLTAQLFGAGVDPLLSETVTPPDAGTTDANAVVFQHYQFSFIANSSSTTLQFSDSGLGNGSADTILDTVSVAPTPTPPPNLLVNGDFETPPFDTIGTVSGWTVGGTGFAADRSDQGGTTPTHAGGFNVGGDSQGTTLSQSFTTTIGQVYLLDFDAGIYGPRTGNPLQLQVQLFGVGTLIDQIITPPEMNTNSIVFQHYQFAFTADSTTTTLRFSDLGSGNAAADTMVDTVSVTAQPTATPAGAVTSFTLVNSDNGQDIRTLNDGAQLNLATLPSTHLNIRANTSPDVVGSVVFALSGAQSRAQTENNPPYALFGNSGTVYSAWTPPVGSYSLEATPYSGSNGSGTAGTSLTISFTVINTKPKVSVSVMPTTINEGKTATFTVSISPISNDPVSVQYSMSGRATAGADYTLSGTFGRVDIPAGQPSATVILNALLDQVKERKGETAVMTLLPGTGYQLPSGKKAQGTAATVTILDP